MTLGQVTNVVESVSQNTTDKDAVDPENDFQREMSL